MAKRNDSSIYYLLCPWGHKQTTYESALPAKYIKVCCPHCGTPMKVSYTRRRFEDEQQRVTESF